MQNTSEQRPRIIVGISGASGIIYGIRMLQVLRELKVETHLVMSRSAQVTLSHETDFSIDNIRDLADVSYANADIGAAISSGSFRTMGMVIAPCSMKTLAEVATGVTSNLLSRSADVILKERRRLILMVRETPLHLGHLRNMVSATEAGAIICPPMPAFYNRPGSVEALVDHTIGRTLDLFGFDAKLLRRWGGE
jgi:4-hydroxy-3-polyprenylbenzoate decarboxylase